MKSQAVLRLSFAKRAALVVAGSAAVAVPIGVGVLQAQWKAQPRPAFEVASVKPVDPNKTFFDPEINHERFVITSNPLDFIVWAYNLRSACTMKAVAGENCPIISGAPDWARNERFETRAKLPEGSPNYPGRQFNQGQAPQLDLMTQSLLEERFKLKVQRETKELPVYALIVGKNRPKLKEATGPAVVKTAAGESVVFPGGLYSVRKMPSQDGNPSLRMQFRSITMQKLADGLKIYVHRTRPDGPQGGVRPPP
jgi:uncharacterized protein (TIGR03435 family)